jgi:hypothetical protein
MMQGIQNQTPAESWGQVAVEALKSPWRSGVIDMTVGVPNVGIGLVTQDYIQVGLGAGLTAFGVSRFNKFARKHRYPGSPAPGLQ